MSDRNLLTTGIIGTIVAAVCCVTPALVYLFAALGISALMGWWIDVFVLYPALLLFMAMTGFAIYRLKRGRQAIDGAET